MIRAFKEEDTETVIRIWLAASVRSHSFIDKAYWEEKAESMRTLYLPLSEIVVDEDRATGEVVAFMASWRTILRRFLLPPRTKRGEWGPVCWHWPKRCAAHWIFPFMRKTNGQSPFTKKTGSV